MTYKYALQKDVTELNKWCLDIIHNVQRYLKEYFTFDIRLVGSGEKRLVTIDSNGLFDLDYNLIIQRDKQDLINDPKAIKNLFIQAFKLELNKAVKGFNYVCDSKSVVKNEIVYDNRLQFKFDVAIMVKADNDSYYKLVNDKRSGNYIWNQIKDSKNYVERFLAIKHAGLFEQFKDRYLELKNIHSRRGDDVQSFSIFLETLNDFET